MTVPSRNEWIFGKCQSIIDDKHQLIRQNVLQMLNKTIKIFKYNGLPDSIDTKDLETYNQVGGYSIWKDVNGKLYCFQGGLGGEPNPYYLPTVATVANPALNYTKNLIIDKDCVVMLNDYYYQGLMPLFNKYAGLITEAEISLKYALINTRIPALVQADNDNTFKSAQEFFRQIIDGKDYGIVSSREFFDGIKSLDFSKISYINNIIESIQYLRGSWYNEIGIKAAYNMKREAINEAETALNDDSLYPTVDVMLECRQKAVDKINAMFGTSITVELDSVWEQNRIQAELELEEKAAALNKTESESAKLKSDSEERTENETNRNADDVTTD